MPPPPVVRVAVATPPQPPRKTGWKIAAFLLLIALGVSLFGNLVLSLRGVARGGSGTGGHAHHAGEHLLETVIEDNDASDKIAVISVDGVISSGAVDPSGATLVDLMHDQLERASADKHVKAVVLKVDSPGGEVLASDEIYKLLQDFQSGDDGKPVVASMGNLAASGGYYISAPCRWIVANELTMTGSIGVIMHGYNWRGLLDKLGVRPQVFKSGKFKDMLSPDKSPEEESAEEKAMIQGMVLETFEKFKSVVAEGRKNAAEQNQDEGRPLAADWETMADGRILSGKTAYEKGFVDELGNFDVAVARAMKLAGIEDANLVAYRMPFSMANLLGFFGKSDARGIKVDLGLDTPKQLLPGRLYYVAPTFVH